MHTIWAEITIAGLPFLCLLFVLWHPGTWAEITIAGLPF
jgi:hypothetical protein